MVGMPQMSFGIAALALAVLAVSDAARAQISSVGSGVPRLDIATDHSTRLLVVSAHPDDETLGAGGLMRRVAAQGGAVHVVWLTSGDGFPDGLETAEGVTHPTPQDYRSYGGLRESEARAALAFLGVDRRTLTFLGFPDEGLCELASTYLSAKMQAFRSPYTSRISPPFTERVIRGVRYRGSDVRRELERLLVEFSPTVVVIPHPEDAHPDHCSAHIFMREALDALAARGRPRPRILHYLIHYQRWPLSADAGTGGDLQPPAGFPPAEGRWESLALTRDEAAAKKQALLVYRSQMLVIGRFMLAFARNNELFLEGEPASMPECWCNGENVATELPPSEYRRRPVAK
jgi:LmbE family N-acetylglucosaminyl deacetylase